MKKIPVIISICTASLFDRLKSNEKLDLFVSVLIFSLFLPFPFVHGTEKKIEGQILLSKNTEGLSPLQIKRLSEIQRHRKYKKKSQAEREKLRNQKEIAKLQPKYENCKGVNLSSLALLETEQEKDTNASTQADFCFTCSDKEQLKFKEIESLKLLNQSQTQKKNLSTVFREKLMKRVAGQVEVKLFQAQFLKNCVIGNIGWVAKKMKNVDHGLVRAVCEKRKQELKDSIKVRWPYMRINLALSTPEVGKKDTLSSQPEFWLDKTSTHTVKLFKKLPPLSKKELSKAKNIYKDTLLNVPLEKLSRTEFKEKLEQGKPLQSVKEVILTNTDQGNLRKVLLDLRQKSKENYSRVISEMPLLVYLNKGEPSDTELGKAFSQLEGRFEKFLDQIKNPETDMAILLAYESLVEELLGENKSFCLTAERNRHKMEKSENMVEHALLAGALLSAVPCLATGSLLSPACLISGVAFGALSVRVAGKRADQSMDIFLTGKDYETLASLEGKDKEVWIQAALFPMAFLGTTARPVRSLLRVTRKALTVSGKGGKTISRGTKLPTNKKISDQKKLLKKRVSRASSLLGRDLNEIQKQAIKEAHYVGVLQRGKDGVSPARLGNYTQAQLREKNRILKESGFSKEEIRKLMEKSIVGKTVNNDKVMKTIGKKKQEISYVLLNESFFRLIFRLPGEKVSRIAIKIGNNTEGSTSHEILGIPSNASSEEIEKAYRKETLKWHPDHNPDNPEATDKFKKIKAAYEVLKNSN